jgi:hypothetical protein
MLTDWLNRVCLHAYNLALILAALMFLLTPLHSMGTQHLAITQVHTDGTFDIEAGDPGELVVGDEVPVYRFNPGWQKQIGRATVQQQEGETWRLAPVEGTWRFPMGRQGTIVDIQNGSAVVNIGSELGLRPGTRLIVFDGRTQVGSLALSHTEAGSARGRLTGDRPVPPEWQGHQATEFAVPNQVAFFSWAWVGWLEYLSLAIALGLWVWSFKSPIPGQSVSRIGTFIRDRMRDSSPKMRMAGLALLAIPVVGVVVRLVLHFFARAVEVLWTEPYIHWLPEALGLRPVSLVSSIDAIALLVGVWWMTHLYQTGRNPAADAWRYFRYKPQRLAGLTPLTRGIVNWSLHWWVLYWFVGTALFGFVKGNLGAMAGIGWADAGLNPDSVVGVLKTVGYMLTHLPHVQDAEAFFTMARYFLWTSCIFGCVIGYGHTIISIVWKREPIRHLDFTIIGWMANLICYDPWAIATYRLIHAPHGPDPLITDGPLFYGWMFTEFFLNLLYTLSILNMGTKFGVMVDKGLVDKGFFSVVRHPSYALEAFMFSVMFIGGASGGLAWIGLGAHPLLYWFRSERDEQFMTEANPDYGPYKDRVRWKFIRGIY